jgi:DNA-binding NtrC family response regulator
VADSGAKRIFLVDDSEDLLDSLEMVLEDRIPGSEIDTFLQASEALKRALETPPDLLVTDYCPASLARYDHERVPR